MSNAISQITAQALKARFGTSAEIAVLDVREAGIHAADGHILRSVTLAFSQIERRVAQVVPRLNTPVIVYDEGTDVLAGRAAQRLQALGYRDVAILTGGTAAWRGAGYELFTGSNVIGKAFGEYAEHAYGTPHLSVREVKARLDAGENIAVLDSRPEPEFHNFSIPGAIDLPGAELVYRFHEAVTDPRTVVVVNCAGRTRSIIGAQALINAGVPNPVYSLANGTMDWLIEGHSLDSGRYNLAALPTGSALEAATAAGGRLIDRFGLKLINRAALARFAQESAEEKRSLYILDVRTVEEFEAGHLPGSQLAPGGQLVQQTGDWIGTQGARIVLVDGADLVRAAITASWLEQINWGEVFILKDGLEGPVETGPAPRRLAIHPPAVETVDVAALRDLLDRKAAIVLDLELSSAYRAGHIPGSRFAIRSRLGQDAGKLPGTGTLVITSADGIQAAFAAADLAGLTDRPVRVLAGGTDAWAAAGLPLATGVADALHPLEDLWLNPYQQEDRFAAFRAYLDWEIGLVEQLERDGTTAFRYFPPAGASRAAE